MLYFLCLRLCLLLLCIFVFYIIQTVHLYVEHSFPVLVQYLNEINKTFHEMLYRIIPMINMG